MKIDPENKDESMITDDEYKGMRHKLLIEKEDIQQELLKTDNLTDDWMKVAVNVFNFASKALDKWKNGTIEEKRVILHAIGLNLVLKDKILEITPRSMFKEIQKATSLASKALFLNTPLVSLMQALNYVEQLTYRQLCIISIIGQNGGKDNNKFNLTKSHLSTGRKFNDLTLSTYQDLVHLVTLGLVGQVFSPGIPAMAAGVNLTAPGYTELFYPGLVLFNTMDLESIDQAELQNIIQIYTN